MLEYLDETWREWSFGQAARNHVDDFGFGHQGAELLSAKGEKIGVLAIFGGFSSLKLSYFWEFRDETFREWTLGIYAGVLYVFLEFGHQS